MAGLASVMRSRALEPAAPELPLEPPHLDAAMLRKIELADAPGGVPVLRDVLQSVDSGLACMFVRMLKPAIYGSVWDALEIQVEVGGYFTVRKDENGKERRLAIKRMPWGRINSLRGRVQEDPLHEIAALKRLQDPGHPHVLRAIEALDDGETVYLLTPFVDGGELFDFVHNHGASAEAVVKPLFRQMVRGMEYIHSRGISHADMSLENALLDATLENAFIIDFGMCVAWPCKDGHRVMLVPDQREGKKAYCAPEMYKKKPYDGVKIDVFGGGCMLFMMLMGFPAFTAPTRADPGFRQAVWKRDIQGLLARYGLPPLPDEVAHLLRSMMAYNADDRPMPQDVLRHPWLAPPPPEHQAPPVPLGGEASPTQTAVSPHQELPAAVACPEGNMPVASGERRGTAEPVEWRGTAAPDSARTTTASVAKPPLEGQQDNAGSL